MPLSMTPPNEVVALHHCQDNTVGNIGFKFMIFVIAFQYKVFVEKESEMFVHRNIQVPSLMEVRNLAFYL